MHRVNIFRAKYLEWTATFLAWNLPNIIFLWLASRYWCCCWIVTCWWISVIHLSTFISAWWRHQMETFSALLAICVGNSPITGEFTSQSQWRGALMFSLICALNKRLSKRSWGWWFETPSHSLWRHCDGCFAGVAPMANTVRCVLARSIFFKILTIDTP